ncbi:hypothetical protein MASR2M39_27470 [Ignavibacteriales bacterium]
MKSFEELLELLKSNFSGENDISSSKEGTEDIIIVSPSIIKEVSKFLAETVELKFDSLILLSAVDDENGEKVNQEDESIDITGGTLSIYYHIESVELVHKLILKVSVERENPVLPSVSSVWGCANWHEREAFDMIGIIFNEHPDLKRILMPYDWTGGHPLRKDYRNPEFYNGMKVPY